MRGKRRTGISSEVRNSVSTIAVLLALPVIAGLFVMILYSSRYQGMIRRMDAAAELKPALETELAEDLFSVAAGRTSFEKSGVLETIHRIDNTLDTLTGQTEGNGHLQLTIARRTMDTMEQYTLKVRDGITVFMENIFSDCRNKDEAIKNAKEHTSDIKELSEKILHENGSNDTVEVSIVNMPFDTRCYKDFSLPAGYYDAEGGDYVEPGFATFFWSSTEKDGMLVKFVGLRNMSDNMEYGEYAKSYKLSVRCIIDNFK